MTTSAFVNGLGLASVAIASPVSAFDDLLSRFENEIYRFLYQLTRSRTQADELYQETVTRAFRAIGGLDGTVNHRSWIFALATSTFLRHERRLDGGPPPDEAVESAIPEDHERLHARDLLREVAAELVRLPAKQRVALVLRKYHDLSYDEIGEHLNGSESATREHAHGALRKLHERLSDHL
jgi:RNA polymerase sigma-70 factor (ECF subfamily)